MRLGEALHGKASLLEEEKHGQSEPKNHHCLLKLDLTEMFYVSRLVIDMSSPGWKYKHQVGTALTICCNV